MVFLMGSPGSAMVFASVPDETGPVYADSEGQRQESISSAHGRRSLENAALPEDEPVTGIRDVARVLSVGRDVVATTLRSYPPPARAGRNACWFASPAAVRTWWQAARAPAPTQAAATRAAGLRPRRSSQRHDDPTAVIFRIGPTRQGR
jgi:hypothetical protein